MGKEDIAVVKKFKKQLSKKNSINKIILFGSRVRGKAHKWSDFDIVIVSDDFKNKKSFERGIGFYEYWKEDYPVDFLCYTPEEFNKLKKKVTIVREAVRNGIEI